MTIFDRSKPRDANPNRTSGLPRFPRARPVPASVRPAKAVAEPKNETVGAPLLTSDVIAATIKEAAPSLLTTKEVAAVG